jgi:hypothetical protein
MPACGGDVAVTAGARQARAPALQAKAVAKGHGADTRRRLERRGRAAELRAQEREIEAHVVARDQPAGESGVQFSHEFREGWRADEIGTRDAMYLRAGDATDARQRHVLGKDRARPRHLHDCDLENPVQLGIESRGLHVDDVEAQPVELPAQDGVDRDAIAVPEAERDRRRQRARSTAPP